MGFESSANRSCTVLGRGGWDVGSGSDGAMGSVFSSAVSVCGLSNLGSVGHGISGRVIFGKVMGVVLANQMPPHKSMMATSHFLDDFLGGPDGVLFE